MEIIVGETVPPPAVQAEDAQHQLITLPVEFVGKVPGAGWLTQIVVRLPDELANAGEVQVRVSFRDRTSNAATCHSGNRTLIASSGEQNDPLNHTEKHQGIPTFFVDFRLMSWIGVFLTEKAKRDTVTLPMRNKP
jgi:hypothetical protein